MIIASLIMSLGWGVISFVQGYKGRIEGKAEQITQSARVEYLLSKDFQACDTHTLSANQLQLMLPDGAIDYQFGGGVLVRVGKRMIDTVGMDLNVSMEENMPGVIQTCLYFGENSHCFQLYRIVSSENQLNRTIETF